MTDNESDNRNDNSTEGLIENLYQAKDLSFVESEQLFEQMLLGNLEPVTISAILTALKVKGEKRCIM